MDEETRWAIAEADRIAAACGQTETEDDDALCQCLGYSLSERSLRQRLSRDGRAHMDMRRQEKLRTQASAQATFARDLSESEVQMTETTEHPYEVLAGELGACAARIELDAIRKVEALKAKLELDLERRLNEQSREIAELRGMIKALLAARTEPGAIDFNEARAAARN